ncbi:MAG: signal peptidase II [Rhodospirillaceae bacterium]|nr:signal peptidase II [Rhodospirillaceae bacterium]
MRWAWLVAAVAFALDQASKWAVLELLDLRSVGRLEVVPGWVDFVLAWNTGMNFGLMASPGGFGQWLLPAVAALVCGGLSWWLYGARRPPNAWGAGLVIGGALGNALDRLVHGAVVDFLNVSVPAIDNPYAFNIADVCVVLGVVLVSFGRPARRPAGAIGPVPPS